MVGWAMVEVAEGDRRDKVWDIILKVELTELADKLEAGEERMRDTRPRGAGLSKGQIYGAIKSLALDVLILKCL